MPSRYLRRISRQLLAFNQSTLKRGSLIWWVRGIERRTLYEISKRVDKCIYYFVNRSSLRSVACLQSKTAQERKDIIAQLASPSLRDADVIISMICASRKINNPNHRLKKFLQSIIDTTQNIKQLELIIRVDDDDDLLYYKNIREYYGDRLCIKIIIGKRLGYLMLHQMNSDMALHSATSSKLIFSVADDCIMLRDGWDKAFVEALTIYADGIVFINTWRDCILPRQNIQQLLQHLWDVGPPALFWVVSKRVLQMTAEVAHKHDGWTACGNNWMCDPFMAIIQFYLWQLTKEERMLLVAGTIAARLDTVIPQHKGDGLFEKSNAAINSFQLFYEEKTQAVIKEMAEAIAHEMQLTNPKMIA